jgi:hypothetical protein
MYISDAGSLTVREYKKQVGGRIFFVNECKDVRGEVGFWMVKWDGKREAGCSEGRWISSLVQRPDRMYSHAHESYDSFAVYSMFQIFETAG